MFTLNMLFFGDFPMVARRCLDSIIGSSPRHVGEVRIAVNAISHVTRGYLERAVAVLHEQLRVPVYLIEERLGARNVGKYPLMRRMFHGDSEAGLPLTACPRLMWFDDDSWLKPPLTPDWWDKVARISADAALVGSEWSIWAKPNQHLGIVQQPWYAGKPVQRKHKFRFATGGWWVLDRDVAQRFDYPFVELHHNGGDQLLGELVRQQGLKWVRFNQGVAINADETGKESSMPRRGLLRTPWPWETLGPTKLDHHNFRIKVTKL